MARPVPPSDDGSPTRLIAAMVGIVGILLLGSLAWSAIGALVGAVGAAGSALSAANPPPATLAPAVAVTSTPPTAAAAVVATDIPTLATPALSATPDSSSTPAPTATPLTPTPAVGATATGTAPPSTPTPGAATPIAATPTPASTGRNPWILLPQPEPGANVSPGQVLVEARGRGDAPIKAMRLELDGTALPVALEQRSDSVWRGSASTRLSPGQHNVRASVTDAAGRSGSYRWSFTVSAAPAP